jgi:hypothetical protein
MAITTTVFSEYSGARPVDVIEVGGYMVAVQQGSWTWSTYNLSNNTARAYDGAGGSSGSGLRSIVSLGGYAWGISGNQLFRLNPATGGVLRKTLSINFGAPAHVVASGNTIYGFPPVTAGDVAAYDTSTDTASTISVTTAAASKPLAAYGYAWYANSNNTELVRFDFSGSVTNTAASPTSRSFVALDSHIYYRTQTTTVKFDPSALAVVEAWTFGNDTPGFMHVGSDGRIYSHVGSTLVGFDPATGTHQQTQLSGSNVSIWNVGSSGTGSTLGQRSNNDLWFANGFR